MNTLPKTICLMILMFTVQIFGGTTGKIVGKVIDSSTGELAGVNVMLENTTLGAATDIDGFYYIIGIPPGKYTVIVSYISYTDYQVSSVEVHIDKTTQLNIEMQSATLELDEAIEVIAERPLVKRDLTSTESTIDRDLIEILPLETLGEVVNLQAGVVDGHFRGGRSDEVLYLVNGVSINDVYAGSNAIDIENNAIQEVSVISGTFNAEYGQAMSGVVNVVTRDGGALFEGSLSGYVGDYVSANDDIFWNIDAFNPITNLQGSIGGPISFLSNNLNFFASGRYNHQEGYIYGKRVFLPSDFTEDFLLKDLPEERIFQSQGDYYQFDEASAQQLINQADDVAMNSETRYSGNIKLSYRSSSVDKFSIESLYQNKVWQEYEGDDDHRFRLNPDGGYNYYKWGTTNTVSWNHVFGQSTFMDIHYSYFYTKYEQNVYEDPFDPRYVTKSRLQQTGANAFLSGGQQMWHFNRSTTTHLIKGEITSQINFHHLLKVGIEGRQHRLSMHEFEIIPEIEERIGLLSSFQNNKYLHKPYELAAYIQDKMEFEDLVINAGLRYDYFDPAADVPVDFSDPENASRRKTEVSSQISPRIGIAYPVSETGIIHASYGHFFQTPRFFYLYTNPEFDIEEIQSGVAPPPESEKNTVGNAELKPQKTTIYEIGLQQQLGSDFGLSVTVYFKDIRNLLGTEVFQTTTGIKYARYINRDYGYVRGITLEFERRFKDGIAANIDYTFQIAKGNASDPNNAFLDAVNDKETEKQVVPLDWDRRHQINASINIGSAENFVVSIIGRYGTGLPYTTTSRVVQPLVENGGRKPDNMSVDVYFIKKLSLLNIDYSFFVRIFNLFDTLNEDDVYTDTGRATYSTDPLYFGGERPRGLNTLDMYYIRPGYYSAPRQIQLGFELDF